jgi:MoxR-like ATPase
VNQETGAAEPAAIEALETIRRLDRAVAGALRGKPDVIRLALTALLARGHLLLEDVPGVGKTTLASALARAVGGKFVRVQFTSDLLPSDLTGISVFDPTTRGFEFRPGPLFANVILADEINRTTPKTQSALLEAMSERRVSVDGVTRALPEPFFVAATQNPVEHHGTFPLPESQLDRFLLRIRIGYPSPEDERAILADDRNGIMADDVPVVTDPGGLAHLQSCAERVRATTAILDYMVSLSQETRRTAGIATGVSPRGSLALLRASRAHALVCGRDYVTPDDVQATAVPVLAHRMVLEGVEEGCDRDAAEQAVRDLLDAVPVPR